MQRYIKHVHVYTTRVNVLYYSHRPDDIVKLSARGTPLTPSTPARCGTRGCAGGVLDQLPQPQLSS